MALSNTNTRYGTVTKTIHWVMALLILTLIPLGWIADQLPYDTDPELARKAWLFSLHKTLGVTAFFVAMLRIVWALSQAKPALLNGGKKLESFAAELVHWMLYGALVIVPLSGWIGHAAAQGFAPIWWPLGQNLPMVPKSAPVEHFFGALHFVAGRVLILSLILHIAGALKHHLIDRDNTLRRMLPGAVDLPPLPAQNHSHRPLVAAILIWAVAVALSAALASGTGDAPQATALAEVSSDWQVQDGSIEITVAQFGSDITGSFADWTAAIRFDDSLAGQKVGSVETTIAISSLTLGSVTQQALGPDFLDGGSHATAVFKGDILRAVDGYEAKGTLRIKDTTLPLTLPFSLALQGDNTEMQGAEMQGFVSLDRRDFGIGPNVTDETTLGFQVKVKITLNAHRSGS
ncbi:MAG: cytochrome b561/polyisoprenoid-binding protein YceI [Sulfitobacter sp.]|jgi:cytochrome b561/polyisoprenoid-binding protein YceI